MSSLAQCWQSQWIPRTPLWQSAFEPRIGRGLYCYANLTDLFFDVFGRIICTSLSNFPEKQFSAVSCSLAIRLDWHASFSVVVTYKNISSSSSSLERQLQELFFILHSSRQPLDGTVSIQFFFWKTNLNSNFKKNDEGILFLAKFIFLDSINSIIDHSIIKHLHHHHFHLSLYSNLSFRLT